MGSKIAKSYLGTTAAIAVAVYFGVAWFGANKEKIVRTEVKPREMSVVSVLRINESETVKVLSVPDVMLSDPLFDTRCLVYTNQEMRQTSMKCLSRPGGPD